MLLHSNITNKFEFVFYIYFLFIIYLFILYFYIYFALNTKTIISFVILDPLQFVGFVYKFLNFFYKIHVYGHWFVH